jgi:hypothetical protein
MRLGSFSQRLRGPVAFWALAGVTLLASHDAVFLVQLGPGEGLVRVLRTAGHDYWGAASALLVGVALLAAAATVVRLARLHREARSMGAALSGIRAPRSSLRRTLATWLRLFAVVAVGFAIQENLEHLGMHGHPIGAGALVGPEYPLAMPVIGLLTLVGAALAALIVGAELQLLDAIALLRRPMVRAPRSIAQPPLMLGPRRGVRLTMTAAGRAPPRMLATPH